MMSMTLKQVYNFNFLLILVHSCSPLYCKDDVLSDVPRGLPWILERSLSVIQIPNYSTVHLDFSTSDMEDQWQLSSNALSSLVSGWALQGNHDMSSFLQANQDWSTLMDGLSLSQTMELRSSILHAQHMMGHWIWWSFLRQEVPKHVQAYLTPSSSTSLSSPWVSGLVVYIHKLYSLPKTQLSHLVPFINVFPGTSTDRRLFRDASLGQLGYVLDEEMEGTLIAHVCQVIVQWLGMPCFQQDSGQNMHSYSWDTQGWIVDSVLSLGHPGLLLLQEIYKVFNLHRLPVLSQPDANRIIKILETTFVVNEDHASEVVHLDEVFAKFLVLPPNTSASPRSASMPSIIPALIAPPTSSHQAASALSSGSNVIVTDVHATASSQFAGDAIFQFLLDIAPVHLASAGKPYKSVIPEDSWVSLVVVHPSYNLTYWFILETY